VPFPSGKICTVASWTDMRRSPAHNVLRARCARSVAKFRRMIEAVTAELPNFQVVATTLREVSSASINDWCAVAWSGETGFVEATLRQNVEIFDRMGGGDRFASGLIYGLLPGYGLPLATEYGAAHGALAMSTPGDTSMASLHDVENLVKGGGAHVVR
jgi:2-dehydro-3-deoxygluconokinase